jgi:hypothetical protein
MNVVFAGKHGYASHSAQLMKKYGGWTHTDGSTQSFWTHHICPDQLGQRADEPDYCTCGRYHMRFFQNKDLDRKRRYDTVSDAHKDSKTYCGNYVKNGDFDAARGIVHEILYGHVPGFGGTDWGNSGGLKQCNGKRSRSDGTQLWVYTG